MSTAGVADNSFKRRGTSATAPMCFPTPFIFIFFSLSLSLCLLLAMLIMVLLKEGSCKDTKEEL